MEIKKNKEEQEKKEHRRYQWNRFSNINIQRETKIDIFGLDEQYLNIIMKEMKGVGIIKQKTEPNLIQ